MNNIFVLLVTLCFGFNLFAADFNVDGISYNITSEIEPYTVEVTRSDYTGSVNIPATVNYNGIDYSVTTIGYLGFENGLTSISLPVSITSVSDNAFGECYNLTSVSLPDSLVSIGDYAFYKCYSLTSINLPNSLTSIGLEAFYNCFGLTSIILPASLTSIGDGAFAYCFDLISIYAYSVTPADIILSNNVFSGVNRNACTLYVPAGSTALYQVAAQWKDFTKIVEFNPTSHEIIDGALEIYPNPVVDGFYVSGLQKETLLNVYDLNGIMLLSTLTANDHQISTNQMPAGVYVVKVGGMKKKIVVKK